MNPNPPNRPKPNGFALVATLLLLILLSILAVGLLSLSSVALRSSGQGTAQMEARANARMALMMAIGELQTYTGADTRITATSDIVDPSSPPLLGAWRSWEGSDHDAQGRPIPPDYAVKTKSESNSGRFLKWLVSGSEQGKLPTDLASLASKTQASGTVPMLSSGTLGADTSRQVHLVPQRVTTAGTQKNGAFAWWVSGENQKALLAQPYKPRTDAVAGWVEMGQSHTVSNPEVFGLPSLLTDPEAYNPNTAAAKPGRKAVSRQTMALIEVGNAAAPQNKFHDLSSYSVGLLTNTATGGWRKDLSLLTEKWDPIYSGYPGGKLPLFRFTPDAGATSNVPKPTKPSASVAATNSSVVAAATPPGSNLYPWSNYSLILGYTQPGTYYAASASWASLQSFATSYKNFSYNSGVVKSPFVWDKIAKQRASSISALEIYNHKHRQLLHPQIARFQLLVYATAVEDRPELNRDPKRYQMKLMYVPFFTLWNPYNVTLEHTISGTLNAGQGSGKEKNFLGVGWRRSLPGAMAIVDKVTYPNPDIVPNTQYKLLSSGNFQTLDWPSNYANDYDTFLTGNGVKFGGTNKKWADLRTWGLWLPEGTLTFKPGEAKIFSPERIDNGYGFGGGSFRMKEGYNPSNIVGRDFNAVSSNLLATQNFWFLYRNDRLTQPYRDRAPGYGFSVSFGDGGSHFGGTAVLPSGIGDEFHNITGLTSESDGDKYWPPDEIDEVPYSVGELVGNWIPIFSASFGPRMTIGTGTGTKQSRPTKGAVQNNALAAMVLSDPSSGAAKDHPANNTFDFAYHSLSIGSTITPNLSNSAGYIGTGYQSGDGFSRLIMDEIPLRPMASLVELQGWNPRGNNPYPPFQMNLIGNSDATPLIPKDSIVPPTLSPSGVANNLQHDDAYCANHLLFDDWFVSSVAPQPTVLGGNIAKSIETFYTDFLTGTDKLSNRSYQAIPEDSNLTASLAAARVQEVVNSPDGWLKIASRLEVNGMFNVNSTSVDAWKAILGHAKSRDVIALFEQNGIQSVDPSGDHPVTRGAVASDKEAGNGRLAIGGQFINAAEYAGFRSLTDAQIEDLAKKIVAQIRERGPFLSLSEFVNRQLGSDDDLALAGAVQTAIDNLSEDPMEELRDPGNKLSDNTMPAADAKLAGADYKFPKAAEGSSAYGAPGWIRQADILRPIAPILSARDDTFTIRAYGDARDAKGNVVAKAWCEAVVRRTRNFCDETDAADSVEPPVSPTNMAFGRRYELVTFKWLSASEV
jgi:type II secretory pathway pseudopilin PulG